jgi:hypothetical protein
VAISIVGTYVGTHAATSAQSVAFSNLRDSNNQVPTLQAGDWVYVAVENASTVNRTSAGGADVLVPSGYSGLGAHDYQNDSNDSNFRVSRKKMGATPDTSVAIPASDATTAGVAYVILVVRGADATTPEDVAVVTTGGINTGIANGAAITPVTPGALIAVFAGAAVAAGAVFTNPTGMSTVTNHFRSATITSTTNDANIGLALKTDWTSGSFDPAAFGGSTSTNTGSWSAVTIAIRPLVTTTPLSLNGIDAGTPTLDTPAFSTIHALSGSGVDAGTPTLASPTLAQVHALSLTDTSAGAPLLDAAVVSQTHSFSPLAIDAGAPTLDSPSFSSVVTVDLVLLGVDAGIPTLDGMSFAQTNALGAPALDAGTPTLDAPSFSQAHVLLPISIDAGSPVLSSADIVQNHAISAQSIDSGAPVLGSPALGQLHVMAPLSIDSGVPTLGSPALADPNVAIPLVPLDITAGFPVLGSPVLRSPPALEKLCVHSRVRRTRFHRLLPPFYH